MKENQRVFFQESSLSNNLCDKNEKEKEIYTLPQLKGRQPRTRSMGPRI